MNIQTLPITRAIKWATCLLVGAALAGCEQGPGIEQYRAPKVQKVQQSPIRTLGAIVPVGETAWFFKITGPEQRVGSVADTFKTFVRSVRFSSTGQPEWQLPDRWRELPGDAIRYRTIEIPTSSQAVDLTVTSLPLPADDLPAYVLSNVNRWRGQIALPPLSAEELAEQIPQEQLDDGATAVFFMDFTGSSMSTGGGMMAASPAAESAPAGSQSAPSGAGGGFSFEAPEQWQDAGASGMRMASLAVEDGQKRAEITVIPLGLQSGTVLENVNRWRGQVKLEPITQAQLDEQSRKVTVSDTEGVYVALHGPEDASIVGVIVPRNDRVWFIKMSGDTSLVEREIARFDQFIQSLRLP